MVIVGPMGLKYAPSIYVFYVEAVFQIVLKKYNFWKASQSPSEATTGGFL